MMRGLATVLCLLLRAVSWVGAIVHILGYCVYSAADAWCVEIEDRVEGGQR